MIEHLDVKQWKEYHLNFHEIYSVNYYVQISVQSDILQGYLQGAKTEPAKPGPVKSGAAKSGQKGK
jgi:hypothetical protein